MLLIHKNISHMSITELKNNSETVWVKVFTNKASHFVASHCRQPGGTIEDFLLFRDRFDYIRTQNNDKITSLVFKIQWISTSHPKLVGRSLRFLDRP